MTHVDILAVFAHPDDVELCVGGTLLKMKLLGYRTGALDVTAGEMGTRGTPAIRAAEADDASRILQLDVRENLGLPDGHVFVTDVERTNLVRALRRLKPKVVLTHQIGDPHPDHDHIAQLVRESARLASMKRYDEETGGDKIAVPKVAHNTFSRRVEPSFIVDISEFLEQKMEAIRAHRSQLRAKDLLSNARERFLALHVIEKVAECEVHLALTFWRTGEYNEAEDWIAEALSRDLPDSSDTRLYSYVAKTLIDVDRKRYREIVDFSQQVESYFRKYSDAFLLGSFYSNLAISHKNLGNLAQALDHYELAKYYHERSRHKTYLSIVENNLAHLYLVAEKFYKAHASIENAAKIFRRLKDKTREGYALDTKASIYLAECKYADALQTVEKALTILKKSENSAYVVDTLLTKAKILLSLDNFSDAVLSFIEAVNIAKVQTGDLAVKRLISEFESALGQKNGPQKKTVDEGDFELILPQSIGHYSDYRGIWINNTRLESVGLVQGSLAVVVKTKIERGDLIALVEVETDEVSCGFYDAEFGIVCIEGPSGEPQIFDESEVRILGKIVGVCNSGKDKNGKMTVESLNFKV